MKKVYITLVIRLFFWPYLRNKTTLRDQCVVRDLFEKSFCFVREAKLIFCQTAVAIQANKQEFVRQKLVKSGLYLPYIQCKTSPHHFPQRYPQSLSIHYKTLVVTTGHFQTSISLQLCTFGDLKIPSWHSPFLTIILNNMYVAKEEGSLFSVPYTFCGVINSRVLKNRNFFRLEDYMPLGYTKKRRNVVPHQNGGIDLIQGIYSRLLCREQFACHQCHLISIDLHLCRGCFFSLLVITQYFSNQPDI